MPQSVRRVRSTFRPQLEALESRWVPATITVTNALDSFATGDGVSLREAIEAANDNVSVDGSVAGAEGFDVIVFDRSLRGSTIFLALGELHITEPLKIKGLGRNQLTISGEPDSPTANLIIERTRLFHITNEAPIITGSSDFDPLLDGVTFVGLTLADGFAADEIGCVSINGTADGGAILNDVGAPLTVKRCDFVGNGAEGVGGAIAAIESPLLRVEDCTFSDNGADLGGGAIFFAGDKIQLLDSDFTENGTGGEGGAVEIDFGRGRIQNSRFVDNFAGDEGGGLSYENFNINSISSHGGEGGVLRVVDSTFQGNEADDGAGIANFAALRLDRSTINNNFIDGFGVGAGILNVGEMLATNCTISGNQIGSNGAGAGIFNDGFLALVNCTVVFNRIPEDGPTPVGLSSQGAGIFNDDGLTQLLNTIVAGNKIGEVGNDLAVDAPFTSGASFGEIDAFFSLIENPNNAINGESEKNILNTPVLLGPLQNNGGLTLTHDLLTDANGFNPAVNRGSNSIARFFLRGIDQRFGVRILDNKVDIGAVEFNRNIGSGRHHN